MKNVLKTSLVAWSLLAFGFAVMSGINPANTVKAQEATPNTWDVAQVILTVEKWLVEIWLSWDTATDTTTWLNLTPEWGIKVSNDPQQLTGSFGSGSFWLNDQAGTLSGYYTTLSVTDLTWVKTSNVIPASNVQLMASGGIVTVTWVANADVEVWSFTNWSAAATAQTFFNRQDKWAGILWLYATDLAVSVTVPAHTVADTYKWTITYTLYDLDPELWS